MTAHTEREGLRAHVRDLERQIARLRAENMAARDRALEGAAKIAETWHLDQSALAAAIRALKGTKP